MRGLLIDARTGDVVYDERPDPTPEQISAMRARDVRRKRDNRLAASDWTQVPDAPVDQQAWADYRQALRDIPQQEGFPEDVVWPEKP